MTDESLLVPPAARVVHIGFNKTGTTAVQGAFAAARDRLPDQGVVYPGQGRYHKMAGIAIAGSSGRRGDRPATLTDWRRLVDEVDAAGDHRVLISSEWMCEATDDQARMVVDDLGGNVHVVATLRPLSSILPSSWQQYLQNGSRDEYDDWLRAMLLKKPFTSARTPSFWRRHQHDVVLARWAGIVGPGNVTAVVVDSRDRGLIFRQFESLMGLPDGFLVPESEEMENRSLTWPEAELLRHVNQAFRDRGWSDDLYRREVRSGIVPILAALRPAAGSMPRIAVPDWALDRASALGARMATNIADLGIRVVGDLDALGRPPGAGPGTNAPDPTLSAPFVASILAAEIDQLRAAEEAEADERLARQAVLDVLRTKPLWHRALRRVRRNLYRGLRRARRRVGRLVRRLVRRGRRTGRPDAGEEAVTAPEAGRR